MYDFTGYYKPGSQLFITDALSRASDDDKTFRIKETAIEAQINLIVCNDISKNQFEELVQETSTNEELNELLIVIKHGWPSNKKSLKEIKSAINYSKINATRDYNNMGITRIQLRANKLIFWPNINKEIADVVRNCFFCLTFQNSNQKEPLTIKDVPTRPWQQVAADLFHFNDQEYLFGVDLYSKYPEVINLKTDTTSATIVLTFKDIFSRHGKPNVNYTDNGPQFSNALFHNFIRQWELKHNTTFIKRHVQPIKKLSKTATYDNKDVHLALLEYRNTPVTF
ncbi:hypothetical protein ILUMI_27037 [Ignelater luminosus]|uniref:RNA-directed DNA polymerase n=1 Tax=Ignelater luminosus TaxID=2038154 RepID=A0A8K0C8Q0_IGNLU|nr:hypothetical protein ILUMI_27037 [Ignelater luminosus]